MHCDIFLFIISVFQSYRTCQASTTAYGGFSPRRYESFPRLVFVVFSVGKVALGQNFPLVRRFHPVRIIPPLLHIHISSMKIQINRPPLWSSGQSFWLQIERSRVRFPALPDFLSSSGSGTGSTQPREVN